MSLPHQCHAIHGKTAQYWIAETRLGTALAAAAEQVCDGTNSIWQYWHIASTSLADTLTVSLAAAAVLDGIVTGKGSKGEAAQERQQMGFILHSLLTGREEEEEEQAAAAAAGAGAGAAGAR